MFVLVSLLQRDAVNHDEVVQVVLRRCGSDRRSTSLGHGL